MEIQKESYIISDDAVRLQPERVCEMLSSTYWAKDHSRETVLASIKNSLCLGVYVGDEQVGFARCVTDYATFFWLADVIIDPAHRGQGLGKALVEAVTTHDKLAGTRGLLATRDAHGLYRQYGFEPVGENLYMTKVF